MSNLVIIVGNGGHGRVAADIVLRSGDTLLGFLDDNTPLGTQILGYPVLGKVEDFRRWPRAKFLIAIGNGATRRRIVKAMEGAAWYTAIHPSAIISPMGTVIGEGSIIGAGAVISPQAAIGKHCIINTQTAVEHDCRIGDYCHIAVGAKLSGCVTLGENVWMGIGAVSVCELTVCDDAYIGAGAVVVKNITEPGTYIGVPAKKMA